MKIGIELIAYMKRYAPADKSMFEMDLPDGATVHGVLKKLGIPEKEARLTLVNGRHAQDDTALKEGDSVVLLTPVEGG